MKVGGDDQTFTFNDTIDDEFIKKFFKSEWVVRFVIQIQSLAH